MTDPYFVVGKCGEKKVRVHRWRNGFSVRCEAHTSLRGVIWYPNDDELLKDELKKFCWDCSKAKKEA